MIKIKLFEPHIHRNETTFRPLWNIKEGLKQLGIELFINDEFSSYDFVLVGQASIADKKKSLQESVEMGLEKLNKIDGDYIIIDGQDAPTLIGTIDVFRHVYKNNNCKLFLKTSYYKDFEMYKKGWTLGRMYWGEGEYSVPDIDDMKSKMKLAGFNWLSTIQPNWDIQEKLSSKHNDIFAMFQCSTKKDVFEHGMLQSAYYDNFRQGLLDKLKPLENKFKIVKLKDGIRLPINEFYANFANSKIVIVPFGYGEIMPRDIETSMVGNILLKNDMSHIETIPNPYVDKETYLSLKWDWSNVEEQIEYILNNYEQNQQRFVENMKQKYIHENNITKRIIHLYELLKNIEGVENE